MEGWRSRLSPVSPSLCPTSVALPSPLLPTSVTPHGQLLQPLAKNLTFPHTLGPSFILLHCTLLVPPPQPATSLTSPPPSQPSILSTSPPPLHPPLNNTSGSWSATQKNQSPSYTYLSPLKNPKPSPKP